MVRRIDPPRDSFAQLPTPLTVGEQQLISLFDQKLPDEWEIYVQPHLNGLRPDIVLLHPRVGVAVFEVKDWNLAAMRYYAKVDRGRPILMARDQNGKHFSRETDNPVNKILLYKRELFELYCPRLNDQAGLAVITAGLVFPVAPRDDVEQVFGPFRQTHKKMQEYPQYYPMVGAEALSSGNIEAIFPESRRTSSQVMSEDIAEDLRGWLMEPFSSHQQRTSLELDARQRGLATTRTGSGYRRIKGPAGSGKSVVLAARASELAANGQHVLVVSFNITLLNYLRDLAVRHVATRKVVRRQIDFLNFHYWCKRVCHNTGHIDDYKDLWRVPPAVDGDDIPRADANSSDHRDIDLESVLDEELPHLVQCIYREDPAGAACTRYDAILVDEGQDFRPSWWDTLRLALKPSGEMVLVADKTQNIYATAAKWTEDAMADAGFSGPWTQLTTSYRLPPQIVPLVRRFAEQFLTGEEIDTPQAVQQGVQMDLFPGKLRWLHVREPTNALCACDREIRRMMSQPRTDTAIADITFLSGMEIGRSFVEMQQERRGLKMLHTFHEDKKQSSRQKRAFFQGGGRIKATTVHSFKGWEARHLIVFVDSVERAEDKALLYTALTRLLGHEHGSCLTVVSCCRELRPYAKSWPDYEEF